MTNFIVSYDLNGPRPSHAEVDALLGRLGAARARILETVWWVGLHGSSSKQLLDQVRSIMSQNDQVLVAECSEAAWFKLLVKDDALVAAWEQYR